MIFSFFCFPVHFSKAFHAKQGLVGDFVTEAAQVKE